MRSSWIVCVCFFLLANLSGCQPEEREWEVVFKVIQLAPGQADYRVRYVDPSGTEIQKGVLSSFPFSSDTLIFTDQTEVYMILYRLDGDLPMEAQVIRDGAIHESSVLSETMSTLTLTTTL